MGDVVINGEGRRFKDLIIERAKGKPLQYILGRTEFMGFEFKVRPGVFIPRPETELLVEEALKLCLNADARRCNADTRRFIKESICDHPRFICENLRILDVGTGSGNIAISLTKLISKCKIVAIDTSLKAIELSKENAAMHNALDRIEFLQTDLACLNIDFDMIVSNPPYIPSKDLYNLPPEVRYEPLTSLDGGESGISFHRRIIEYSKRYLNKQGYLLMEIGQGQAEDIQDLAINLYGLKIIERLKDYNGIERVIVIQNG